MPPETDVVSLSTRSLSSVPRAVWVGGGVLGLVAAALAGALVTRSIDHASTPLTEVSTAVALADVGGQPVPLGTSAAVKPVMPATPVKPVHSTKAATAPQAPGQSRWSALGGTNQTVLCASCGVVESVNAVQRKGQGTGLGAVAGGVLGGVVGHQAGGGSGKTALTVLGAIGGGLAGNEVEKRARGDTVYDIQVRMEDGSIRVFQRPQEMTIGARVVVEGSTLRLARESGDGNGARTLRTSASPNGST